MTVFQNGIALALALDKLVDMKFLITELNCLRLESDYQYKCYCKARQYTSGIKLRESASLYSTIPENTH